MGRWVRAVMLLCTLAACGGEDAEDTVTEEVKSPLLRTGALFPQGRVRVCWQLAGNNNPTKTSNHPQFVALSQQIRDYLEDTIARVSAVKFTDWTDCPSTNPNALGGWLAIRFLSGSNNNPPGWSDLGYNPNRWTELVLSDYAPFYSPENIRMLTQHETMHALGFGHEYDRVDRPTNPGSISYEYITPYDSASVTQPNPRLSRWDIVGLQQAYGFKRDGAIVARWGRCLSIPNYSPNSVALTVEDCVNGVSQQEWSRRDHGQLFSYGWTGSSWIERAARDLFGLLVSEPTSSSPDQKFDFTNVELRVMGDWCAIAREAVWGSDIVIAECGVYGTGKWDYEKPGPYLNEDSTASHRFRLHGTDLCLSIAGAALHNEPLRLQPCGGNWTPGVPLRNALFSAELGQGRLKPHVWFGHRCIGVLNSNPVEFQPLVTMDCNPQYRSAVHVYIRGQIKKRNDPTKCITGSGLHGGGSPLFGPCSDTNMNQVWDYHPVWNSAE